MIEQFARCGRLSAIKALNDIRSLPWDMSIIKLMAAYTGQLPTLSYYAMALNFRDERFGVPIEFAAIQGHLPIIKYLVSIEANPIGLIRDPSTLCNIIAGRHTHIIRYLKELDMVDDATIIDRVMEVGNTKDVKILIDMDIFQPHDLIISAAKFGRTFVVKALNCPDVDDKALIAAVTHGHKKIVRLLAKHPVPGNILETAVMNDRVGIAAYLAMMGANVTQNMIDSAKSVDMIVCLSKYVCQVNYDSLLYHTALAGDMIVVDFLINRGADVAQGLSGAIDADNVDMIDHVIQLGADVRDVSLRALRISGKNGLARYLMKRYGLRK